MTEPPVVPASVTLYGGLGAIPFVAPAVFGLVWPHHAALAAEVLRLYAALILSFLGGARWGLAIARTPVSPRTIGLAMLPTLVALALLSLPRERMGLQLLGLAAALTVHAIWDLTARDVPTWYPRLRLTLTLGAVAGLLAGALVLHG